MTITEFQSMPTEAVIPAWHSAANGPLLQDRLGRYHLQVSKTGGEYTVLVSHLATGIIEPQSDVKCGCPLSNQPHLHYWESSAWPEEAIIALLWAVDAIRSGAAIKLAHSTEMPL